MCQELSAIREKYNTIALENKLPPIGSKMINKYGIEWIVYGHFFAPTLSSMARDYGNVISHDPRDLLPVIIPQNMSPRLNDFFIQVDRCTSKHLIPLDTMPNLHPNQSHPDGHSVDAWSDPNRILFFFDAVHLHETIFAHELGHVWIDLIENCEDYRMMRDLSDTSRVRQFQYIQSFVLDRKVNDVIAMRGFDMTIIHDQQFEAIHSIAQAVNAGYHPPSKREAACLAPIIAAAILDQNRLSESSLRDFNVAIATLKQGIPEICRLAEEFVNSVSQHGVDDGGSIKEVINECAILSFRATGDSFDIARDLEEVIPTECYQDKFPKFFPGFSVREKLEIGKAMAKHDIGANVRWRIFCAPNGSAQIRFLDASYRWTEPTILKQLGWRLDQKSFGQAERLSLLPYKGSSSASSSRLQRKRHSARNYMPGIGLWMSRIRLAEQIGAESPYKYAYDNPVSYVSPSGRAPISRVHKKPSPPSHKHSCKDVYSCLENTGKYNCKGHGCGCKAAPNQHQVSKEMMLCVFHVECEMMDQGCGGDNKGGIGQLICSTIDTLAKCGCNRGVCCKGGNKEGVKGKDWCQGAKAAYINLQCQGLKRYGSPNYNISKMRKCEKCLRTEWKKHKDEMTCDHCLRYAK